MIKSNVVKVLFFIDRMAAGGKERRLTELMKALKLKSAIQFELVVMNNEIHYKEILDLGIKIHYLVRNTKRDLTIFHKFYKICKNSKPDIVHSWDSMTSIYSAVVCKLLGIQFANGMVVSSPVKQNIFDIQWARARLTFPLSDLIIGNSKAGLKAYRAPKNKSVCIPNGFNFERINTVFKNGIIKESLKINTKYVIGMVATFSENKDYKTYFDAAQLLLAKRKDITFLAVGSDTDSDSSKGLIQNKFLEHFRLLGKRTDVESLVNVFDIGIMLTNSKVHGEGISNSILEYMAMGKPVIASYGGGTNEIVEDNKTGFLIAPSNSIELSEKMEILLSDTELRCKMGRAGKNRIENHFSIDKMVKTYISTYENLCLRHVHAARHSKSHLLQ